MDGDALYTIGELANRTGLSVRTIRFYSDEGVVPPTCRTEAGYRLYDAEAAARLDLVRTLRDLGVDLGTIQRVLEREIGVGEVASAHAEALDVQIRTLRLRRAVLRAVAKRGSTPEEIEIMHKLARLSDEERRRIITDFIDESFAGLDLDPGFEAKMRSALPELPDDPEPEQVDAWVELAELVGDPDFRAAVRRMAEYQAADLEKGTYPDDPAQLGQLTGEKIAAAIADGIEPRSDAARPIVDELVAAYAEAFGAADDAGFRRELRRRTEVGTDRRAERYWQLIATINGWPVWPAMTPSFEWFVEALRD
ncbi:MerR family transcriptional regulator [Actinomadura darangshiensis]|uniref:MerR family transcriptional regulator n=1 Tax=Actinomadura darangshiensis TaxID=705336 RepID=A0A4R5AA79_9ACTN|nr:MerR family transcriptional regulator [Actinomadura darangshiensis]TDD68545.1 MerR family transcriptional regulator [Actinomadura darangshiensis]